MENTEATVEVATSKTNANILSDVQAKALNEAIEKLQKTFAETEKKKYLVDLKKEDIEMLSKFMANDAPWKFNESLGIVEVNRVLAEAKKTGKLFIGSVPVEAIWYYLSKVEGKGNNTSTTSITDVESYLRIVKPFFKVRDAIAADQEVLKKLEFIIECRKQGIEPDATLEAGPTK